MMKRIFFLVFVVAFSTAGLAQDMTKFKLYDPEENAKQGIADAVQQAKKSGKHVFIQVGGNWCIWCARFNEFTTNDKSIDSLINENYIVYHLNYSKENENREILEKYRFPQRFGFPVFLILNADGNLIHTQSSWYLEAEKSYDKEKVMAFFGDWGPKALDPKSYK